MDRRIMHRLEQWHVLYPSQFRFCSGFEVVDACSRLAKDIVAAFCHGEVVQAVTLYIQSPYNTVWTLITLHCFTVSYKTGVASWRWVALYWTWHQSAAYHKAPYYPSRYF